MNSNFLFIAGAPRSGTTFLMNQLSTSTSIISAKGNESYYFMDQEHPLLNAELNCHKNGIGEYINVFPSRNGQYLLDGTDHLMYQLSMIDVINQLPNKKMIFIFREPASRIYSSFNYTKNNLGNFRKDVSFKEYVNALIEQNEKLIQNWMYSEKQSGFVLSNELNYSHYHVYLEKWINKIGRDNMIFLSFDEMINNEYLFFDHLIKELGIDDLLKEREVRNESYGIKNKFIHQKMKNIGNWFPQSKIKNTIKKMYFNMQKEKLEKSAEEENQINELKKVFLDSNKRLEELTNLDLSTWK